MAAITGAHHLALTVSDARRSADWYSDLLGFQELMSDTSDEVSFTVLAHPDSGWVLGLREYLTKPKDGFDEFRTGMDHVAFGVASRAELEAWLPELEKRKVEFTPIVDTPIGSVIVFRDPDRIQLELWLPMGSD